MPLLRASLFVALALASLGSLGCQCETPPPVTAPIPPSEPPPPAPAHPDVPVLAWRTGPAESGSLLVAIPPYPASAADVLSGSWIDWMRTTRRMVVLSPAEAALAGLTRHGPGTARRPLRELLGETPFRRLVLRLGSATGRPNEALVDGTDPRGALVALALVELGFRGPGESPNESFRARAAEDGIPVTALLDVETSLTWAERMSEEEVVADLLERIEDPGRTVGWGEALRVAFDTGDVTALETACREPERTSSWAESGRAIRAALAAELAPSVERELRTPGTMVVLEGCLLPGATGLVELLRARELPLEQLVPEGMTAPGAEVIAPTEPAAPTEPTEPTAPTELAPAEAPGVTP